ncbi:MAG TPA: hypothetical protein VEA36_03655 [Candidatus Paceibacterota bacterium]|nr:hypothetical protein [Candidatus Paceibacterota bacterium]
MHAHYAARVYGWHWRQEIRAAGSVHAARKRFKGIRKERPGIMLPDFCERHELADLITVWWREQKAKRQAAE